MLVHTLFVIYVLSCEIELVPATYADKLDFWDPKPKDNARRVANHHHPKHNHPNHESKTRLNKGKHKVKVQKATVAKTQTGKMKPHMRSRTKDVDNSLKALTKWPKIQQRRSKMKSRRDAIIRSTRMTPMYLMQQSEEQAADNETTTTAHAHSHTHKNKDDEPVEDLSPYSIKHQIDKMAKDFPAANISVEVIGRTIEYNDIVMMKVTEKKSEISAYFRADDSKYVDEVSAKKVIFIVHGLSVMGMENIPCLVSNPQFKTLLSFYFSYLDKFDIFLIPMANPDGFVMSKRNYIWNKNMSPQGACSGVALDRNFDVSWNTTTTTQKYQYIKESSSSCSQHFPGLAPFSEPETKAIREVFHHYSHKMSAYLHVHSGSYDFGSFKGDAVLYPKGYTEVQSDDDKYIDLRGEIEEAMKNASFQIISVAVETLHTWYGQISGSSVDYASTVYGVPYAMELVMQPFQDIPDASQSYSENALNEIWKRVLDVIFNNIWRNTNKEE